MLLGQRRYRARCLGSRCLGLNPNQTESWIGVSRVIPVIIEQKREEKLQRKLERKQGGGGTVDETPESEQLEVSGEPEAAAEPASPELP